MYSDMVPRVTQVNRALLALSVIQMRQRARWFTKREFENPTPDDPAVAFRYAVSQASAAALVVLLKRGFEPQEGLHVSPRFDMAAFELELTDGFSDELAQHVAYGFRENLTAEQRRLLESLGAATVTSPFEEGIDNEASMHEILGITLFLCDVAAAKVGILDKEIAGLQHEDYEDWKAGKFGDFQDVRPVSGWPTGFERAEAGSRASISRSARPDTVSSEIKKRPGRRRRAS